MWWKAITVLVVVVFPAGISSAWSPDDLPYPYEFPRSVGELEKKLKKPCSFQFDPGNITVVEAIEKVGDLIGEKITRG